MLKTLTEIKMGKEHCQYDAHKSAGFPFAVYYSDIKKYLGQYIPAHWHREFEISLVIRGKVRFFIDNTELLLSEGEGVFINSNVFHGITASVILRNLLPRIRPLSAVAKTKVLLCKNI